MSSRFYGSVKGSAASEATRQGTAQSGVQGHVRGWNLGVYTDGEAVGDDTDSFDVFVTGGSHGIRGNQFAFRVQIDRDGRVTIPEIGRFLLDATIEILEED